MSNKLPNVEAILAIDSNNGLAKKWKNILKKTTI